MTDDEDDKDAALRSRRLGLIDLGLKCRVDHDAALRDPRAATERPPSSQKGIRRCCSLFSKGTESIDDGDSSSLTLSSPPLSSSPMFIEDRSVWESLAGIFADKEDPKQLKDFVQYVTLVRVGIPSLFVAGSLNIAYP